MDSFFDNDYKKTINNILEFYYSNVDNDYVPAYICIGNYYKTGIELNFNLFIKKKDFDTLEKINLPFFSQSNSINYDNILVDYLYNNSELHGLNFRFMKFNVNFTQQRNHKLFDLEYMDGESHIRKKVLLERDGIIFVLKDVIGINSSLRSFDLDDYELYATIRYQEKIKLDDYKNIHISNSAEYISSDYFHPITDFNDDKKYDLLATVKIDPNRFFVDKKEDKRYKVYSHNTGKMRYLDTHNLGDDLDVGLLGLTLDAKEAIERYYSFYDLMLISKFNNIHDCIAEVLPDKIIISESEFNKYIPSELKDILFRYNIKAKNGYFMSAALDAYLFKNNESYVELLPNYLKLAFIIRNDYFNQAIENDLDFFPPASYHELKLFIVKILKVLNLSIYSLNISCEYKILFNNVINDINITDNVMDVYKDFAYIILKELGYGAK